ncbi:DUF2271 domain-containing protein [Thalassobaculum sp. OXR-137]|uniref:DUF2271 domain-containing protein n=1 Tax=Thalassobaculum sp. OXR-137 TaxID=3100173 RepID=UPI002AC8AD49|nr:DUF2271 domain-containing protein [Thalassobaculum sp. OXR-137]WPZ35326.1 DUF2271 domain-containing protein [Thalassobaculum sp. OXR-137]
MRIVLTATLGGVLATPALASSLEVTVDIPELAVAEYHRPYVGIWLERPDSSVAANLALWYDHDMRGGEGTKWLKDMRQWWRRIGRDLSPAEIDGVSGPTRAPGSQEVVFEVPGEAVAGLADGDYVLVVEAAREVGGREVVRVPFSWPAAAATTRDASGAEELGRVTVTVRP